MGKSGTGLAVWTVVSTREVLARRAALRHVLRHRSDELTDRDFDEALLPLALRRVSSLYWTPVRVARRAAQMLDELGVSRLLDVGSGAGKFSVVAAACAPRITFVGIEHRPHLVAAARALAESVGVGNVTFEQGDVTARSWAPFDGVYVFNSFSENGLSPLVQIDQTVELSAVHRLDEVMRVERCLAMRDEGAILLTYHGLGGPIPSSYECVREERVGTDRLRAWRKGNTTPNGEYWFEDGTKVWRATIDEIVLRMGGVLPLPRGAGAS